MSFKSEQQRLLFESVVKGIRTLGYSSDLLVEDYAFEDLFATGVPRRVLPMAAFGRTPPAYDTACIGVLLAGPRVGAEVVSEYRAFGAPVAFEVDDAVVRQWKIAPDEAHTRVWNQFPAEAIEQEFERHSQDWAPETILRAKNIPLHVGARQLDFIDLGLLPALEQHVREKLDSLLRRVLTLATRTHRQQTRHLPDDRELFRLVFRFLAAKVLCDRKIERFRSITDFSDAPAVLRRVSQYYSQQQPVIGDRSTQQVVADELWSAVSFQHLSVEALAYIYEQTLVDDETRRSLGTHSTPPSVARYVVARLFDEGMTKRPFRVVEPCSGHGMFLVAALERLRDLLPSGLDPGERHRFFVRSLQGFEMDEFALEISRLCLMLADFPYPNGWRLDLADVFESQPFNSALREADVVLCNPPFEDFKPSERERYSGLRHVQKPAELLHRVLEQLKPDGTLGFVLPRQFLDGRGYRDVREPLNRRFQALEIVALPDRVFWASQHETALLIAREPSRRHESVQVSFAHVADSDANRFLMDFLPTWRKSEPKALESAAASLRVNPLDEVWQRLRHLRTLGDIAELHRGVEWHPPFQEDKYISQKPKPGFRAGFLRVTDRLQAFAQPEPCYLSFRDEDRRGNAFDLPWDAPKAFVNSATVSRGPWRLAAFSDSQKLCCSQQFTAVWPRANWAPEIIAAVLNGPVASAFVATREGKRHNRKCTLSQIPAPSLTRSETDALTRLVSLYVSLMGQDDFMSAHSAQHGQARQLLLCIDALLLRAYGLPPRLERQLLDSFRGHQRRVPFPFAEYFPLSFKPHLPLWMFLSDEIKKCNSTFLLESLPRISDPGLVHAFSEVE